MADKKKDALSDLGFEEDGHLNDLGFEPEHKASTSKENHSTAYDALLGSQQGLTLGMADELSGGMAVGMDKAQSKLHDLFPSLFPSHDHRCILFAFLVGFL